MTKTIKQCLNNESGKYVDVSVGETCGNGFPRAGKEGDVDSKYRSKRALQVIVGVLDGACDDCIGRLTAESREEVEDVDAWE